MSCLRQFISSVIFALAVLLCGQSALAACYSLNGPGGGYFYHANGKWHLTSKDDPRGRWYNTGNWYVTGQYIYGLRCQPDGSWR